MRPSWAASGRGTLRVVKPRRSLGQSLVETAVVIALVAIGTIGVVGLFGNNIRALWGGGSQALAGETEVTNTGRSRNPKLEHKTMSNFGYNPAGSETTPE